MGSNSRARRKDVNEETNRREIPTTGAYFGRMLLLCVPVANIIAAFVWGFGGETEEKRRFGRGALLVIAVAAALSILGAVISFAVMRRLLFEFA